MAFSLGVVLVRSMVVSECQGLGSKARVAFLDHTSGKLEITGRAEHEQKSEGDLRLGNECRSGKVDLYPSPICDGQAMVWAESPDPRPLSRSPP